MPSSGLGTLKRSWSGPSLDVGNGQADVMGIQHRDVAGPVKGHSADRLHGEITNTVKQPSYEFDDEFDEVSWSFASTPKSLSAIGSSAAHSAKEASRAGTGLTRASQVEGHAEAATSKPSTSIKMAARTGPSSSHSDTATDMRKRQFPSAFFNTERKDEKFQRTAWAKSASELRSNGEKLSFLIKGNSSNVAAGTGNTSIEPAKTLAKIFLSKEQQVVYDRVVNNGKSMFFTGSAGTGKSVALREIIKGLRRKYEHKEDAVAVTASTGIAACNIGGITLHAFAGAGLCEEPVDKLVGKVKKNRKSASRWMRTQVLVIDEVSMVNPDLLDKLEAMGRSLRRSVKPFGGIQVIMTGDFFQLPPVVRGGQSSRYAFDAKCWDQIAQEKINLTQVFRQKDPEFVNMLNELRFGRLSPKTIGLFSSLTQESELHRTSGMSPTILFPMRKDVEKANAMELLKIKRPSRTFDARDDGSLVGDARTKMADNFMAPSKLHLKMGCQVMLIKNTDEQLVNGSIGTVLAFLTPAEWQEAQYSGVDWDSVNPEVMTEDDILRMIHQRYVETRNGEMNMTEAELQERNARSDSRNNILGDGSGPAKTRAELAEAIRKEERRERSRSRSASPERREAPRHPVVRFLLPGPTRQYRTTLVMREIWKNEQPNGEVMVSRSQIPLILAWAMSIHKSQGQTLPLVKIDLSQTFEKGQAYVALSRAVSKEGLQVLGFESRKVKVDQRVVDWYKNLPVIT